MIIIIQVIIPIAIATLIRLTIIWIFLTITLIILLIKTYTILTMTIIIRRMAIIFFQVNAKEKALIGKVIVELKNLKMFLIRIIIVMTIMLIMIVIAIMIIIQATMKIPMATSLTPKRQCLLSKNNTVTISLIAPRNGDLNRKSQK